MTTQTLYYGFYDHTDSTFFKSVKRLSAGATLVWKNGITKTKKYWDLAKKDPVSSHLSDKEVRNQFTNLLADAINIRFRSDVPVGIGLSSGLDSSTLFYYAKNALGKQPSIFSECAESDEYNECAIIKKSLSPAEKLLWHTCSLSPAEVFNAADPLNRVQGEPYAGVPIFGTSKRYELVRKRGTIVLLDGEGPDELLCGYRYYAMDVLNDKEKSGYPRFLLWIMGKT
ncbi:MAG: hypothetical protein HYW88_02050 [Candidatus Sungbacteria bacterium]|nr:hypothetical protein [Candidatus Sungbacteria bacterium]